MPDPIAHTAFKDGFMRPIYEARDSRQDVLGVVRRRRSS
jgi:hypothetical protein